MGETMSIQNQPCTYYSNGVHKYSLIMAAGMFCICGEKEPSACPECKGSGYDTTFKPMADILMTCPTCNGTGLAIPAISTETDKLAEQVKPVYDATPPSGATPAAEHDPSEVSYCSYCVAMTHTVLGKCSKCRTSKSPDPQPEPHDSYTLSRCHMSMDELQVAIEALIAAERRSAIEDFAEKLKERKIIGRAGDYVYIDELDAALKEQTK